MKKIIFTVFFIMLIIFSYLFFYDSKVETYPVQEYGNLSIKNLEILNSKNEPFLIKGISSSGIQWSNNILTEKNLRELKNSFGINTFRIAMYTEEDGYIQNSKKIYDEVVSLTDTLIDLDLYVIIDWHILKDGDPNAHIEEAKDFFDKYSKKYANIPNILYEICNEPNGNNVTWNESIKPYADTIIPIIRNNAPNSIIIVGTPYWCTKFADVSENPLEYSNVLYACHYYAGEYLDDLKSNIEMMRGKNLPILVTETGLTDKTGNGNLYENEFKNWISYLNKNHIGYIYWSFSNMSYTSSMIKENRIKNIKLNLTDSGKIIKSIYNK